MKNIKQLPDALLFLRHFDFHLLSANRDLKLSIAQKY